MTVCTFDNPSTARRECWTDGSVITSYAMELFFIDPFPIPASHFFFGANIGPWKDGQIVGNAKAMEPKP